MTLALPTLALLLLVVFIIGRCSIALQRAARDIHRHVRAARRPAQSAPKRRRRTTKKGTNV